MELNIRRAKMKLINWSAITLICGVFSITCFAERMKLTTPRGAMLDVIADFPAGNGPFPAIVFAPGQGYHMGLPLMETTAKEFVARGFAVYRFNWAYFSNAAKKGEPSPGYAAEVEDMNAVLAKARDDARVAKDKVVVAGKSLGSIVAWQVLAKNRDVKGGIFLTPVCSRISESASVPTSVASENYPGITKEKRPLAFVAGELDPLCAAPILYRFVAEAGGAARVLIVGGDHGFANPKITGSMGDEIMKSNVKLVALLSADFVAELMR